MYLQCGHNCLRWLLSVQLIESCFQACNEMGVGANTLEVILNVHIQNRPIWNFNTIFYYIEYIKVPETSVWSPFIHQQTDSKDNGMIHSLVVWYLICVQNGKHSIKNLLNKLDNLALNWLLIWNDYNKCFSFIPDRRKWICSSARLNLQHNLPISTKRARQLQKY